MTKNRGLSRDTKRLQQYFGQPVQSGGTNLSQSRTLVLSRSFDNGSSYELQFSHRVFVEYELSNAPAATFVEYEVPGAGQEEFTKYEVLESKPVEKQPASPAPMSVQNGQGFFIEPFETPRQLSSEAKPCGCGQQQQAAPSPQPRRPDMPPPTPPVFARSVEMKSSESHEDDFMADMQSILDGKKRYDPSSKQIVNKENAGLQQRSAQQGEKPLLPLDAKNEHDIFDKIAQSMRYANAYDLGSLELEKRFNEFDRVLEAPAPPLPPQKSAAKKTRDMSVAPTVPTAGTAEFLNDLDEVHRTGNRRRQAAMAESTVVSPMTAPATALDPSQLQNSAWWATNSAAKRFFEHEPATNIDQFTLPDGFDSEAFYRDFTARHPLLAVNIIGDRSQPVAAQYFVVHDRGDEVLREAPATVADVGARARGTHLFIGYERVLSVNDWHQAGDGTGLERRNNTCFVHVELTQHARGLEEVAENGIVVKASGTRFTHWQYEMLAYSYIVASLRRGRFLTTTIHREIDRALEGGHGDPRDFDVAFFYQKVNALLGIGDAAPFTYGIQQDRVMSLRQVNMGGYINEFVPYSNGSTYAANQYGAPRRNADGSWSHHPVPIEGPRCGNGQLFNT